MFILQCNRVKFILHSPCAHVALKSSKIAKICAVMGKGVLRKFVLESIVPYLSDVLRRLCRVLFIVLHLSVLFHVTITLMLRSKGVK